MHVSPGPFLVGLIFLWTGGLKAVSPNGFYQHLEQLGLIPQNLIVPAIVLAAGGEAVLGTALVVSIRPEILLPATVALLFVLTAFTAFSIRSGRVTDCGCYAGFIVPSMPQTLLINGVMAALVASGMIWGTPRLLSATQGAIAVLLIGGGVGGFAWYSLWYARTKNAFLINLSPIKIGKKWNKRWSAGNESDDTGELIVTYLGPDCPFCKMWVPLLNGIDKSPTLPGVVGIVGASRAKLATFRNDHGLRFSTGVIPQSLMSRLVTGVPTTVLVRDGIISDIWRGQMSPEFGERFKHAFFPAAFKS